MKKQVTVESSIKYITIDGTKQKSLRAFRFFRIEFTRLYNLYINSLKSYLDTRELTYSRIKSDELHYDSELIFKSIDGVEFKINRASNFAHALRTQAPPYLRELIFVRFISALEIFLTDSIKELFFIDKKLIRVEDGSILEIPESEYVSYDSLNEALENYIENKCRKLRGQGFNEIQEFYLKKISIDFQKSKIDLKKLEEYHDKRHILVHGIGRTDSVYMEKYNTDKKVITIEEEALLQAYKDIGDLAFYVNERIIKKIDSPRARDGLHKLFKRS